MAGLVLRAVGGHADVVAEDYALSGEAVPEILARLRRLPSYTGRVDLLPADVHECRAETMVDFLLAVDEQYGSVAGFLLRAGLEDDVVPRLHDLLVDRAGASDRASAGGTTHFPR